jgi:hypothetical protein
MNLSGIDFSHYQSVSGTVISAKGYQFVINYLGSGAGYLTGSLVTSYESAGLSIVSVYEVTKRLVNGTWVDYDPKYGQTNYVINDLGYNYGVTDGINAYNDAKSLNQTAGSAIYFAIDADAFTDISYVSDYFRGIAEGFAEASNGNPTYKVSVYGSGYVLDTIYNAGLAVYKWLANPSDWTDSSGYTNYDIWQKTNGVTSIFQGQTVDLDITSGTAFGQWGTTAPADQPPTITGPSSIARSTGQTVSFTSLLTASDPDGTVAQYVFSDSTPGSDNGYLTLNGGRISGTSVTVSAANLSEVGYYTGSVAGSNAIDIGVIDNQGTPSVSDLITTITITKPAIPPPPVLSGAANSGLYVSGGTPLTVDAGLIVTDTSKPNLTGATVVIGSGLLAGDVLGFTNQNGISGSYTSASGTLVLSGTASVSNYQTLLESITYSSTAADATNGKTDNTRQISWVVSDGQSNSSPVISGVDVWPPYPPSSPPVLSGAGNTVSYRSGGSAVGVDVGLTATDPSAANLVSATVVITSGYLSGDTLSVASLYGINSNYNSATGALTLSGLASLTEYNAVLSSVAFSSTAADATNGGGDNTRSVRWSVNDGRSDSAAVTSTIDVWPSTPPANKQPYIDTDTFPVVAQGSRIFITGSDLHVTDPNPSFPTFFDSTSVSSAVTYTILQGPQHGVLQWVQAYPTLRTGGPSWYGQPVTEFTQNDLHNGWFWYVNSGDSAATDSFNFTVSDGYGGTIGLTTATIPIDILPTISGTIANQAMSDKSTISPLTNVTVGDSSPNQTLTAKVSLSQASNGTLSNLDGGTFNATTGVYSVSGTLSSINTALRGLVFKPTPHQASPGETVTTGLILNVSDTAGMSVTDSTTTVIAAAGTVTPPVVVNNTDGTSYLYAYSPSSTVAETIASYSGLNNTGSIVADIVDNTDGTCLVYAYNPTATVKQTTQNWSATNIANGAPAGSLLADVVDNTDGTCLVYAYNPTATVKQTTQSWSATNAANGAPAGTLLADVVDNTDGTCLVYAYNPTATVTQTTQNWSATNVANGAPAGTLLADVVDNTDGTSIVYAYNPASGVAQTATYYSSYNAANGAPTGTVTGVTFDYTNGESAITTYNGSGAGSTIDYSGPDGTGSVIPSITQATGGAVLSAAVVAPSSDVITITGSGQLIDPGTGSHAIQFISGAANDTLVLHLGGSDQITGFDPAAGDVLDLKSLLSEAGVSLGSDLSQLANYVSVADVNGSAEVLFDPTGHGGGSQVALLANDGGLVAQLQTLKAFQA